MGFFALTKRLIAAGIIAQFLPWPVTPAFATTSVKVLATDPPGDTLTLGRNQNFYLRLGFDTDEPVHIWTQPFFQGAPVAVGSNPSSTYTGSGEALGWFFFLQPGSEVDEIRIRAGNGTDRGTLVVATYPVRISAGDQPSAATSEAAWVPVLRAREQAAQRQAYEQRMNTPVSAGDRLFSSGFMLLALGLGLAGFGAPVWALLRWQGAWRIAAMLPAGLMAFVVLRLLLDTSRDPTSHNLWPFEMLMFGAGSAAAMLSLWIVRRLAASRR
jgi:hypothetical protein